MFLQLGNRPISYKSDLRNFFVTVSANQALVSFIDEVFFLFLGVGEGSGDQKFFDGDHFTIEGFGDLC